MKIAEMHVKVYLLQDISKKYVTTELMKLLDTCLVINEETKIIHNENRYKFYNYGGLTPVERDGIYKAGNVYTFVFRTMDRAIEKHLDKYLFSQYTNTIKVLTVEKKIVPKRHIERIYSLTPVIIKSEGYWRDKYNMDFFEDRIRTNLIKKYNTWNEAKIEEDFEFYHYIKLDNKKPIAFTYPSKNITLLGDKITLMIAENERAQELAYLAIASGLGEMGSRGAGFVQYRFL